MLNLTKVYIIQLVVNNRILAVVLFISVPDYSVQAARNGGKNSPWLLHLKAEINVFARVKLMNPHERINLIFPHTYCLRSSD